MLSEAKHLVVSPGFKMRRYYDYIVTNRSGTLYTGITNDLRRRIVEPKSGAIVGFTSKYKTDRLVYAETLTSVKLAILREKQIKGWVRRRKVALVESVNPTWKDLTETLILM